MAELRKILMVEDDASILEITTTCLTAVGGFVVEACDSGKMAIRKFEEFAPDLILLDVMMPGIDGPETLVAIRKLQGGHVPAIFLTAKVMEEEVQRLKSAGAIAVIAKPYDPMTLSDEIRSLWNEDRR